MILMVYDIIIIGGGPAGLSAAIYALRANLNILIIEKLAPGGQLLQIKKIHNYPGILDVDGAQLAYNMYEQVNQLKGKFVFEEVEEVIQLNTSFDVLTNKNCYHSKRIIVASGTTYASLKVPLEKKFIGKGISYCAVCDGKLYTNKEIAIVLETKKQLEECFYLAKYAKKIYIITQLKDLKEFENQEKFVVYENYKVTKLFGEETLNSIEIKGSEVSLIINIDGLFVLTSSKPSSSFLHNYSIFSSDGYMIVDHHFESAVKGLFGVGDVIKKDLRQVVTACNDGAIAAQYIASTLEG